MTKLKQFSYKIDILYSRENKPWIEVVQFLISRGELFPRDLGKTKFYRALEEAMWRQGMTG